MKKKKLKLQQKTNVRNQLSSCLSYNLNIGGGAQRIYNVWHAI